MGRVTSDPITMAYIQIILFSEAVLRTGVPTREELRKQLASVDIDTPAGHLRFDEKTGHFSKCVYIGQVNEEGQFDIIESWNNGQPLAPDPVPFPDLSAEFDKEEGD